MFDSPLEKYKLRCMEIPELGLGLFLTSHLYRSLALSVLSFVAQVRSVPTAVLDVETCMLRRLVPGPGNWIGKGAFNNLDNIFGLPGHFPSIRLSVAAAKCRVTRDELHDFAKHRVGIEAAFSAERGR